MQYLSSKEAAEKICDINRPSFLLRSFLYFLFVVLMFFVWIFLKKTIFSHQLFTLQFIYFCSMGYILLRSIASFIMHFKSDGKYWDGYTYEPSWYDKLSLFPKRLFALESLDNLDKCSGEMILLNGAIISGLICKSEKWIWNSEGFDSCYVYDLQFTIEYCGKQHSVLFKGCLDLDKAKLENKQGQTLLIMGKISEGEIKKFWVIDAMLKNKDYDRNFLKPILFFIS